MEYPFYHYAPVNRIKNGSEYVPNNAELTYYAPILTCISHIKFPNLMQLSLCK